MSKQLKVIHPHAAGIDIGAEKIFVSVAGQEVKVFATYTASLLEAAQYLRSQHIQTVAMEATGVYWIPLYEILEQAGLEVCLVNGIHVKQVPGRKSDMKDCQWIQELHSHGLLPASFIPKEAIRKWRSYVRLRDDHIRMAATHVNHIQKALDLMNIKLHQVIAQIQGASGLRIIRAILSGEREAEKLADLCEKQILKSKRQQVILSLEGNYQEEHLFALKQALACWEFYQTQILECDKAIEQLLQQMTAQLEKPVEISKPKAIRHHKPEITNLHEKLLTLTQGKDASRIPGLTDLSLMQLLSEIGWDMTPWPTAKHFTSWLGLSPLKSQSGKVVRKKRRRAKTRAGQIFRLAAHSIGKSKYLALSGFYRRIRSRSGSKVAMVATARKIAVLFYNLMKHGVAYVEEGIKQYEENYRLKQQRYLLKLAKELNYQVQPLHLK